ncbi:N4-gp56 family major capsid protein [Sphingopyxis flava]|uniref:Major capsid protein, N4-gp56 family n=1 Tax=Sphingopyxis flava TaxID=1507287 RepID=A0A1T5ABU8_9SPHN|nr:N4-gp56 family major capsid protein [Sphingopyxis flava]SKB32400.1 major capsid protein, N4-gp56 family [Sphingopyxis flava]
MTRTAYGDISQRTAAHAYNTMLEHAEPVCVLGKFGDTKPIPRNKAETVKFRRPIPFTASTTPLQEGVTPNARQMLYEDVPVTLEQYGDLVVITDKVNDLSEDPVLRDASEMAGENAGRTLEQIIYGVVKGGTSVFYANGSSRGAVNTAISLNKQRKVTRYLKAMKAKKFTKILGGSVNIGTKPIEAAYIGVAHTDLEADIRGLAGFTPVAEYGQRQVISEYEIGSVEDVRYILSPDLEAFADAGGTAGSSVESTSGTNADVYPVLYFGMHAFGLTPLKNSKGPDMKSNMAMTPTVINPDTVDKSDPLGQRGYVGWKTWFAAVRLNETWMTRLEVAATAL